KNEENVTLQFVLYSNIPPEMGSQLITNRYNEIKKILKNEMLPILRSQSSIALELDHADLCVEQAIPSSNTSYNVTFLWETTDQTKLAVSEPMCLNDWRLITRKCQPSVTWGATWGRVDISQCTKYQSPVEGELFCLKTTYIIEEYLLFLPSKYISIEAVIKRV
ncbi:hypothetical protein AVEN_50684-1, partial [Araneus ventricosus]